MDTTRLQIITHTVLPPVLCGEHAVKLGPNDDKQAKHTYTDVLLFFQGEHRSAHIGSISIAGT